MDRLRPTLPIFCCCVLLPVFVLAQSNQNSAPGPEEPARDWFAESMARLAQGKLLPGDVSIIARSSKRSQAVTELKRQFETTQDRLAKLPIAAALVRLGDKNRSYWDYLVQGAVDALTSDIPSPQRFDANGKAVGGEPSPEYLAWTRAHHLTLDAIRDEFDKNLTSIMSLGESRDPRAIPLLRQALYLHDDLLQAFAALALAQLKDNASIPLIIQACREAPADAAVAIGNALIEFDDPKAQAAAREFRPGMDGK